MTQATAGSRPEFLVLTAALTQPFLSNPIATSWETMASSAVTSAGADFACEVNY